MKLTEHFDLSEFTRSATADRLHIDNSIDLTTPEGQSVFENLKNLCEQVLEPLRNNFGVPVIISSGYRCAALNRAVGGVKNSQHLKGEAVDIVASPRPSTKEKGDGHSSQQLKDWFLWLQDNTRFDQLIMETNGTSKWIHISLCRNGTRNRQRILQL